MNKPLKDRINLHQTIYTISHDFKNDILSLRGLLQLLLEKLPESEVNKQQEIFNLIGESIEHSEYVIDRLLEYSRISTRGKPSCLASICEIVEEASQQFSDPRLNIVCDCHTKLKIDEDQFILAFYHLIDNALKFCDKSLVEFKVNCYKLRDNNKYIIEVSDNGPGILPKEVPNLFMMFQPGSHVRAGLGLGLATVKNILERHSSDINYDPINNKFTIELPISLCFEGTEHD